MIIQSSTGHQIYMFIRGFAASRQKAKLIYIYIGLVCQLDVGSARRLVQFKASGA